VPPLIEGLTGRFVLIFQIQANTWLFHDAVAMRQVNYAQDKMGETWCASQAETLAERLGFELDPEVISFKNLPVFTENRAEFWLLNDRTPYREVRNLLPNHFLDLSTGCARRYWPVPGCIKPLSVSESIEACTPILKNSIKAAANRFDLRMGCSAGIDSRKTLAATRGISDKIYYFSHAPAETALDVNDVLVPARLLPKLGIVHHNLGWKPMTDIFRKYFEASATFAREKKGNIAHVIFDSFGPEATVLNSNISEVAQCIYWLPKNGVNGENLAILSGLKHPFAITEFQKWVDGALSPCQAANLDILALFFLEQRMGRWCMAAFAEYDIAHETFNPYNNRHLHCLMLGVDERHRRDRRWDVSLQHIRSMWPEVLQLPINPQDRFGAKIQQFLRRFVVHKIVTPYAPFYQYLRFAKRRRRFRKAPAFSPETRPL